MKIVQKLLFLCVKFVKKNVEPKETLLYLQGGPGFPSPRPTVPISGWQKSALEKPFRILLLDQRGTGRSTPVTCAKLQQIGNAQAQAEYLSHFRSDNIVRDCEIIRKLICSQVVDDDDEKEKISLLGQSFGGFCILSYLSLAPHALERCLLTCGLAPIGQPIDHVYTATFARMKARSEKYYRRYPQDIQVIRNAVRLLEPTVGGKPRQLPRGGILTARRFLQLGLLLGSSAGFETLHNLLESGLTTIDNDLTVDFDEPNFLNAIERAQEAFETNPIYFLLHESIYSCSNSSPGVTNWSAERVLANTQEFQYLDRLGPDASEPILLYGEHVFSWMAEDYAMLRPLQETANILAAKTDWGPLYDLSVLKDTKVPCAGLVSYEDIYVEREFAEATATILGNNCRLWLSNEFQHSGLRDSPKEVFERLLALAAGTIEF